MIKVEQLPNVVNSADQFHDYLHRIFDMYKADDLKTLEARSKTTGQDIVYQQAVKNMIQFAETLNDSGVGGCFAIVEINGNTIITDDEPFVAWNQGRGRLHTEHRLLPLLLDNLRDYGNPGEICEIWCDVIIR